MRGPLEQILFVEGVGRECLLWRFLFDLLLLSYFLFLFFAFYVLWILVFLFFLRTFSLVFRLRWGGLASMTQELLLV